MGMLGMPQATSANEFLCKGVETKVHQMDEADVFRLHAPSLHKSFLFNMQVVSQSEVQGNYNMQQGT